MRRSFGTASRRRLALLLIPLSVLYMASAVGRGDWLLAVPGAIVFVSQVVVVARSRPTLRRTPPPPPVATPTPAATPRRPSARERAAARRRR